MVVQTLSLVQKGQTIGCSGCGGCNGIAVYVPTIIYHYSTVSTASTGLTFFHQRQCSLHHIPLFDFVHCIHCIHWFDLSAPKTMSPPPYSTIPLRPLHLLCPLHPLESPLCNSYTTWYLCFFLHNLIVLLMVKSADMGYLLHYTEIEVYT